MRELFSDILSSEEKIYSALKKNKSESSDSFSEISDYVIAPVVYMYTAWIINQAEKKKLKRIYFFSRDGYLMYNTAVKICESRNNGIECSYFYCSRYSLRMAAYWFKDDCAYDKLFYFAYRMSACMLLKRAEFSESERKSVYEDIGYTDDENESLGKKEFSDLCERLKKSEVFNRILYDRSFSAYERFCWYVKQEGFYDFKEAAVVDLGWNGSMQYTLRKLFDKMGIKNVIHGFYLGMFSAPPESEENKYSSWLFDSSNKIVRSWFAHNLLECMCSAPHGMTKGYDYSSNKVTPVLAENENSTEPVRIISNYLNDFRDIFAEEYSESYKMTALKLLYRLMVNPDKRDVEVLEKYCFCDDVAEQYHRSVAAKTDKKKLRMEIIPFKFFYRDNTDGLYWYYGSVAACGYKTGFIYKLGYTFTRFIFTLFR